MVKEIYCKLNSDINYESKLETDSEQEKILQQIKIILGTKPGDVLGSFNFGIDLQKYLFDLKWSPDEILYIVNSALAQNLVYDATKWTIYADISYGHNVDDAYEYAVIDIIINQNKCLGILVNQD